MTGRWARSGGGWPVPSGPWRAAWIVPVAVVLLAGCTPAPVTAEGREVDGLYRIFLVLGALVALLVYGLGLFAILRYRDRRVSDELPRQIHGHTPLEIVWTAIPVILIGVLFAGTLAVLARTEAEAEQPGVEIEVEAFRWGWTFSYPAQGIEVSGVGPPGPEVVVPVGVPIRFVMTGVDVEHAFFVPRFLFKRDAIPGRVTSFDITVEEPGTYRGQCAEFCGIGHAAMPFAVRAVPGPEFDAWLTTQAASPAATSAP